MKIIAECPEEDKLLNEAEKILHDKGVAPVSAETFDESFLGQVMSAELSKLHHENIETWTPSQRLWFYDVCKDFFEGPKFREFFNEYQSLVGIYSNIFEEERKALSSAACDFTYFLEVKRSCELLKVDNYKKLKRYLEKAVVKGKEHNIKTVSAYFDQSLSGYVIELNSIKIPFTYRKGKLEEDCVIYGWSDSEFRHSYEFLKTEVLLEASKKVDEKPKMKTPVLPDRQKKLTREVELER